MKKSKSKKQLLILLLPLGLLLTFVSSRHPEAVEKIYSDRIFRLIGQPISSLTGILPFSLAEIIVILSGLFIIWRLIYTCIKIARGPNRLPVLFKFVSNVLIFTSFIYFGFIALWGFNYQRMTFASIAKLDTRPASISDLEGLCSSLIERANKLRTEVPQDKTGLFYIPGGYKYVLKQAPLGYKAVSKIYSQLGGSYGNPKPVFFSRIMSYAGISGVYFPFTAEANVDIDIPESVLPATACHEMAHQRGFAREDEANYIAYLTATMNPDPGFQYSGVILALINSMNALYDHAPKAYYALAAKYSEGVRRDLAFNDDYWKKYEGFISKTSDNINDAYLKANGQSAGVESYGRMVDLLIAEYKAKK